MRCEATGIGVPDSQAVGDAGCCSASQWATPLTLRLLLLQYWHCQLLLNDNDANTGQEIGASRGGGVATPS